MIIKVKLKKETSGRLIDNIKVNDTENIVLRFESEYDLSQAKLQLNNGDAVDEYPFRNDFTVPDKFLFKGRLFISVAMYSRQGALIKKWEFFPLTVNLEDGKTILYDYLTDLENRLKKVEENQEILY